MKTNPFRSPTPAWMMPLIGWVLFSTVHFSLCSPPAISAQEIIRTPDARNNPQPWRPHLGAFGSGENEQTQTANSGMAPASNLAQAPQDTAPQSPAANPPLQTGGQEPNLQDSTDLESRTTKVTRTFSSLPNSAGQVWREYDISPYTSRITNSENPQQAIVDWILKETGTEMWFNHPLGILSATKNQLYVYHTPEVQQAIHRLVDRFVYSRGQVQSVDITLMTVDNPNWRSSAYPMLQSVESKSLGVEAFVLSKESAALLQSQLARRSDARLVSSGTVNNHDGQPFQLRNTRQTQFFSSLQWVPHQLPNYQPITAKVDEGYAVSINCLSGMDARTIEAIIQCDIDQIEKLTNVKVDAPSVHGNIQPVTLQIPQIVSWRFHERFRWSNDQVLLLTCGVVSGMDPNQPSSGISIPLLPNPKTKRADALLFIDYRGPATGAGHPQTANPPLVPLR